MKKGIKSVDVAKNLNNAYKAQTKVIKEATSANQGPGRIRLQQADGSYKYIPFEDATGEMVLQCTQADIDDAVCGNPFNCVMARMFRRTFGPLFSEVRVGKKYMHVVKRHGDMSFITRFAVKGKLAKAIHTFDISRGKEKGFVAGETYTIVPPAPSDKRNGRGKKQSGPHNGKGARNVLKERAPATRNIVCYLPTN